MEKENKINLNTITEELTDKLEEIIEELYTKVEVNCIILADLNGKLLCHRKNRESLNETNLAILFASDIGTTVEISREIDDKYGFNYLLHEGNDQCVFLCSISKTYVLGIIFDNFSLIGVVRLFAKKARQKLIDVISEYTENHKSELIDISIGANFTESLSKQCDDLFNL